MSDVVSYIDCLRFYLRWLPKFPLRFLPVAHFYVAVFSVAQISVALFSVALFTIYHRLCLQNG